MKVTIFTPAYNRAHLLPRLYESLEAQICKDFEWVVVDDGSKDNTREVVEQFAIVASFPVRYFYQENGGKHRAINRGVKEARGELFFIVDSDDSIPAESIETIVEYYDKIKKDNSFGGISGLLSSHCGDDIINEFPGIHTDEKGVKYIDCTSLEIRYLYNVKGDLGEVFKTSVLREFPFPEIDGERFCPEALVWNRIAQKYKLRFFDKIIYYRDYLEGGLTDRIVKIRMDSPVASTIHYSELNSYEIPLKQKMKAAINYWRFWCCLKHKKSSLSLQKLWIWTFPIGWAMFLRDKRIQKKKI